MQTHADLRIGTLVRWHGGSDPDAAEDIDELGIVVEMAGANSRSGSGNYHIAWSTSKSTSHHSPEMIEESLYQGQMEVLWNRK